MAIDDTLSRGESDVFSDESPGRLSQLVESQLNALLDLLPFPVRIVDREGRIVRENGAASMEYGGDVRTLRELWEKQEPRELITDGTLGRLAGFAEMPGVRALMGERVVAVSFECRRQNGLCVVEISAMPVWGTGGDPLGAVLIQRDSSNYSVTSASESSEVVAMNAAQLDRLVEQRSRELLAGHEEDIRKRRLSAVGQLAAGVMHDVNNALNPIMAAAYLLEHHAESPVAVREYAERIRKAAEMGAATASRVGRFIRQEPLHSGGDSEIDLATVIEEVLDMTHPMRLKRTAASNEVRVESSLEPGVRVRGIVGELREALLNLIQNAVDAMPDGGLLRVKCWSTGDISCVSVEDTGVGMSREVRDRAFEPFFTTKGAGGTGLGLAEVYGIVQRHRGEVSIDSTLGHGTRISICMPRLRGSGAGKGAAVSAHGPPKPMRILVVEDHDDGRLLLRRILERDGHIVDAVASVAEARKHLERGTDTPYDLMLTDAGLPDGNGWDLAKSVRGQYPTMRVGLITGWGPSAESEADSGIEFVLRKPLRAQELKAHIEGRKSSA